MLSGSTQITGLIGHPVAHSASPAILNAAYQAAGLDWAYVAFDVEPGSVAAALGAIRALGIRGLSVTMPHKDDVFALVDELTDRARLLAAVNCVSLVDGRLVGDNTDGRGLLLSLRSESAVDVAGRSVGVLGAGGAARSIVAALGEAGAAEVAVVNRTTAKAEAAAALAGAAGRVGAANDLAQCDVIVNATSIGMGDDPTIPLPVEVLRPGQIVVDIVYHPLDTPLLQAARAAGAVAVDGLGMLVGQAGLAFETWTGLAPPLAEMRAAARDRFSK